MLEELKRNSVISSEFRFVHSEIYFLLYSVNRNHYELKPEKTICHISINSLLLKKQLLCKFIAMTFNLFVLKTFLFSYRKEGYKQCCGSGTGRIRENSGSGSFNHKKDPCNSYFLVLYNCLNNSLVKIIFLSLILSVIKCLDLVYKYQK